VNVCPAIVRVPLLAEPELAATEKVTDDGPVPAALDVIVIHVALLAAVHAQSVAVFTVTGVPVPPAAAIDSLDGEMLYEHGTGAGASCVTVTVRPSIVMVPVRCAPLLAATLKVTVPLPLPVAADVIVIHAAPLVALHVQSAPVVTAIGSPGPPAAATDAV
jgi:hypothetical protein